MKSSTISIDWLSPAASISPGPSKNFIDKDLGAQNLETHVRYRAVFTLLSRDKNVSWQ